MAMTTRQEVIALRGPAEADIWSYGITGIELASGEAPYQRMHPLKAQLFESLKDLKGDEDHY